jgi:hypothetical protein
MCMANQTEILLYVCQTNFCDQLDDRVSHNSADGSLLRQQIVSEWKNPAGPN